MKIHRYFSKLFPWPFLALATLFVLAIIARVDYSSHTATLSWDVPNSLWQIYAYNGLFVLTRGVIGPGEVLFTPQARIPIWTTYMATALLFLLPFGVNLLLSRKAKLKNFEVVMEKERAT